MVQRSPSRRVRRTRVEAKEQTRADLLRSSSELFVDLGYNATTVDAIVELAGFTRGAFYAHFADKADLFATLLAETREAAMARIRQKVAEADEADKVQVIQTWYENLDAEHPWALAYAEFWPQAIRDPALRARLADRQAAVHHAIEEMITDYCSTAGIELPIPIAEVAAMMLAIADGVAAQRHLQPHGLPSDAFMRTVTYLWYGLLGDAAKGLPRPPGSQS